MGRLLLEVRYAGLKRCIIRSHLSSLPVLRLASTDTYLSCP